MSKELSIDLGTTGLTVTANVYLLGVVKATGIACAEIGVTGKYSGDFTATPNDPGVYQVAFFNGAATVSSGGGQIVWDGAAEVLQTGDNFARIGAAGAGLTDLGGMSTTMKAQIEAEVDDALGAGTGTALTAIPWNAAWDAEVQSEATDALNAYDPPTNTELEARTLVSAGYASPTNITAGTITTVTTLTNLPAIPANWLTAAGTAADFTTEIQAGLATPTNITAGTITTVTNLTNAPTAGDLTATMKTSVTTAATAATPTASAVTGAVGSVTGSVGSVTGFTAANIATIMAKTDNLPSDPADASVVAGLIDTVDNFIDTEIADIQARLPAALTGGGNMKSDALAISGSTAAADNLEESAEAIGHGTCTTGGSTTTVIASSITPASAVNDQYNGRVMIFKNDTTTAALRGQGTTISDFNHATQTFTVVALTTAPASGDTFSVL